MIHWKTATARVALAGIVGAAVAAFSASAEAGPPRTEQQYDMAASGFVMPPSGPAPAGAYMPGPGMGGGMDMSAMQQMSMPKGMIQPKGLPAGGVAPVGFQSGPVSMNQYPTGGSAVMQAGGGTMVPGGVSQTGFFGGGGLLGGQRGGCDSIGCDACGSDIGCGCGVGHPCGCGDSGCSDSGCGGGCPLSALCQGGVLGQLTGRGTCESCGGGGCGSCGGGGGSQMSNVRHICLFCRGDGCAACQSFNPMAIGATLQSLRPYSEGGKCAQRFYDLSVEASFLGLNGGGIGALTTRGVGGPVVLDTGDLNDDLEAGVKISGAMIFGVGGNLELTYHGGHEWSGTNSVTGDNDLFSYISDFGALGSSGFDDTDQSVFQSASLRSRFHSAEFNYRRRTMGPYCRFQGSYLFGLRYVRFDQSLGYNVAAGEDNDTDGVDDFFSLDADTKNNLFGGQIGFDGWYSVVPGINLGMGLKGAWMKNEIRSDGLLSANSAGLLATPGTVVLDNSRQDDGTVLLDFELAMLYRLTHSFTFRTGYQVIAIDDIGSAGIGRDSLQAAAIAGAGTVSSFDVDRSSLVLQGFTVGAEYTW